MLVLIETLWNVKMLKNLFILSEKYRINRNIVECKGKYLSSRLVVSFVLIETLWNVKLKVSLRTPVHTSVLIETLWNVKDDPTLDIYKEYIVLIETLWNVKDFNCAE